MSCGSALDLLLCPPGLDKAPCIQPASFISSPINSFRLAGCWRSFWCCSCFCWCSQLSTTAGWMSVWHRINIPTYLLTYRQVYLYLHATIYDTSKRTNHLHSDLKGFRPPGALSCHFPSKYIKLVDSTTFLTCYPFFESKQPNSVHCSE